MDVKLSKNLSWLLRHGAMKEGLNIRSDGFVDVSEVLSHRSMRLRNCSLADIVRVVETDLKGRYVLQRDESSARVFIKATQGHSVEVKDLSLREVRDPASLPVVVHGTYSRFWERIKTEGLKRMGRNHIHLTSGESSSASAGRVMRNTAVSGFRSTCDILIYVDAASAMQAGVQFFLSENNVILTTGRDGVLAPQFFQKVIEPTAVTLADYKCKLCFMEFDSINLVLRHELTHMVGAVPGTTTPQTGTKRRKNGGKPVFRKRHRKGPKGVVAEVDELLAEMQDEVRNSLMNCDEGAELNVLCRIFQPDPNYLAQLYGQIVNDLEVSLGTECGGWNIQAFGSTITGMAFKDSDIDFYISPKYRNQPFNKIFNRVHKHLMFSSMFKNVYPIRGARVPIIKCYHQASGVNVDINMSSSFGVYNSFFISKLFQFDQRVHPFMLILKIWAKCWCITKTGRMTNYTLILLIVFYLQMCPSPILPPLKNFRQNVAPEVIDGINFAFNEQLPNRAKNRSNIRNLLKGFFEFYSTFDLGLNVICPFLGKALNRADFSSGAAAFPEYTQQLEMMQQREEELKKSGGNDWNRDIRHVPLDLASVLVVQDPFCLNNNTAKTVGAQVFETFKRHVQFASQLCNEQNNSPSHLLLRLFYEQPPPVEAPPVAAANTSQAPSSKQIVTHICRLAPVETEMFFVRLYLRNLDPDKIYQKVDIDKTWNKWMIKFLKQSFTDLYKFKLQLKNNQGKNDMFHLHGELEAYTDTWQQRKCDSKKGYAVFLQEQANFAELAVKQRPGTERLIHCRVSLEADIETFSGVNITLHHIPPAPKNTLPVFFKDFTVRVRAFLKAYFEQLAMDATVEAA